ncbi:hypothetical protein JCM10212_003986 [Sporobolomyces blumeae]
MSNSDKFEQDDAIVSDNVDAQAEGGVLGGADEPLQSSDNINAPTGNEESISENKISDAEFASKDDEFDGVRKDNIIEGERSTRGHDFTKADEEADKLVDAAVDNNIGTSRIA